MERDEVLKVVRSMHWPSCVEIYTDDAILKGDLAGFASAGTMERTDRSAWEPVAVQLFDSVIIWSDGSVAAGKGAIVPFERIERIEAV